MQKLMNTTKGRGKSSDVLCIAQSTTSGEEDKVGKYSEAAEQEGVKETNTDEHTRPKYEYIPKAATHFAIMAPFRAMQSPS